MPAVIGSLRAELSATIAQFQRDLGKAADSVRSVSAEFGKVGRDFKKTGDQMQGVGKSLSKTLTLPLLAFGVAAGAAAKEFDDAFDIIRTETGATGQRLADLKGSFSAVFAEVPNQAADVAEAISAISSRTGAVGPALEDMATRIANLARLTKSDIGELAASSTRAFGDWSIATEQQAESLDFLFRTSQQTGIQFGRLTDLVVQFGAPMRALGFSFEQSAALMGKFEKEGVNLETVMSGLRFALGKFAEAGKDPAQAFAAVTAAIKNAKTESEATRIAFQTFGKRAAIDMSRAILEGRFNIDELVASLKNSKDTINTAAKDTLSFSEKFETLRHKVAAALEPLGTRLLAVLEDLQPQFEAVIGVLQKVVDAFGALPKSVQSGILILGGVAAAIGPITFVAGQAISSLGTLAGAFGKTGLATKGIIKSIDLVKKAMLTLRGIDIGSGMFSILAGAGSAAGIGLAIGGGFVLAGALAEEFRKKLEAQGEAARRAGKIIPELRAGYISLSDAQAKAAETGQELADGLEVTLDATGQFAHLLGSVAGSGGVQNFAAQLAAARAEIDRLSPAVRRDLVTALEAGVFEMKELGDQTGLSEIALKLFQTQLEESKKAATEAKEGIAEVRDEIAKVAGAVNDLQARAEGIIEAEELADVAAQFARIESHVDDANTSTEDLETALSDIFGVSTRIEKVFDDNAVAAKKFGDVLRDIPKTLAAAFAGGGGLKGGLQAIGTQAVDSLFGEGGSFQSATRAVTGGLSKVFGKTIGGALGAAIPGIGALVGPAIEGLGKLFGKIFGTAGRDAVRAFAETAGGFDALHQQLNTLGDEGEELWIALTQGVGRNNPEEAKAAIDRVTEALERNKQKFGELQTTLGSVTEKLGAITVITPALQAALDAVDAESTTEGMLRALQAVNAELDQQAGAYDEVKAALDKYGISAAAAGDAFQQETINRSSQTLLKEFKLLRGAGVDVNEQMRKMGPAVRDFIKEAQLAGVEVPESMMEVIQTAIDAGEVFDADGKKISNISDLGLKFGTTMQEAMATVGTAVDRLTRVLEGLARFLGITLPKAAETGVEGINRELEGIEDPVIRPKFELPDIPSGYEVPVVPDGAAGGALVTRWGLQHLALGGFARGTDTVPAMLTPGELVLNAAQQETLAGNLSRGGPSVVINLRVDGIFSEGDLVQTVQRRLLPLINQAWEDNVSGSRTRTQDALAVGAT